MAMLFYNTSIRIEHCLYTEYLMNNYYYYIALRNVAEEIDENGASKKKLLGAVTAIDLLRYVSQPHENGDL